MNCDCCTCRKMKEFDESKASIKRAETRKERYKQKNAKYLNCSLVTVEFQDINNVGFLIRAAACFGVPEIHVIGYLPCYKVLKEKSGTTNDLVKIYQYSNPQDFIEFFKQTGSRLVCMELSNNSVELKNINKNGHFFLALGNETSGIPIELMLHADQICHIKMEGPGYCLNTSQTGNIALYELTR